MTPATVSALHHSTVLCLMLILKTKPHWHKNLLIYCMFSLSPSCFLQCWHVPLLHFISLTASRLHLRVLCFTVLLQTEQLIHWLWGVMLCCTCTYWTTVHVLPTLVPLRPINLYFFFCRLVFSSGQWGQHLHLCGIAAPPGVRQFGPQLPRLQTLSEHTQEMAHKPSPQTQRWGHC